MFPVPTRHSQPECAPLSATITGAWGEHLVIDAPHRPRQVLALIKYRESLMRRIAERERAGKGARDLSARLVDATVKQIRAEIREEKQQRRLAS